MGGQTPIVDAPPDGSIGSILRLPEELERLMFGPNVDMTPEQFLLHAGTSYAERVDHHIQQYRATIYTIGMIAGVAGTDEEQEAVRTAIADAVRQYGASLTERNQREHWYSDHGSLLDILSTAHGATNAVVGTVIGGAGAGLEAIGDFTGLETVSNAGSATDGFGDSLYDTGVRTIYTDYDGVIADAITDLWNSIVQAAQEWWAWFEQTVGTEGLIIALGQAHVDASFLAAEIAIDIGIGVLTAGWGAAAFRAIRIVGRRTISSGTDVVIKLVREGADTIDVKRLHHADVDIPADIEARVPDLEDMQGHPDVPEATTPNAETPTTTGVAGDADADLPPATSGREIPDADWEGLRSATPSRSVRQEVQGQHPAASVDNPVDDPVLPGLQRTGTIEADHIVPAARIRNMPGFSDLTRDHQLEVLNAQDNFHGLSRAANASRGDQSFTEWTTYRRLNIPVEPAFRERMILEEARMEGVLQDMIYDRLRRQQAGIDPSFRGPN